MQNNVIADICCLFKVLSCLINENNEAVPEERI